MFLKFPAAVFLFIVSGAVVRGETVALKNYDTLTHTVSINSLRAGSHDPSGTNEYFFVANMYSLINSADERNIEFSARKKIHVELGKFAEMKIESLKSWKADEKTSAGMDLAIDGDAIRKLAAQSMQEFGVQETDIAVMVEITMFEKSKKYYFFGEDTLIAKTEYFPVSQTKLENTADIDLVLQDIKGTNVLIKIKYKTPAPGDKKQAGK